MRSALWLAVLVHAGCEPTIVPAWAPGECPELVELTGPRWAPHLNNRSGCRNKGNIDLWFDTVDGRCVELDGACGSFIDGLERGTEDSCPVPVGCD